MPAIGTETNTHSETETFRQGEIFSHQIEPGEVVALFGTMGAGKTAFIRGVCNGLGVSQRVNSPTFVIINEYHGSRHGKEILIRHFDFYRISGEKSISELGIDEFVNDANEICLIEWSEHIQEHLPPLHWRVRIEKLSENDRTIKISKKEPST